MPVSLSICQINKLYFCLSILKYDYAPEQIKIHRETQGDGSFEYLFLASCTRHIMRGLSLILKKYTIGLYLLFVESKVPL
jgi:hypothetical protein